MAKLTLIRARSVKELFIGTPICNPSVGQLRTPPSKPYNGHITIDIGDYRLVMEQEEFDSFAEMISKIAAVRANLNKKTTVG